MVADSSSLTTASFGTSRCTASSRLQHFQMICFLLTERSSTYADLTLLIPSGKTMTCERDTMLFVLLRGNVTGSHQGHTILPFLSVQYRDPHSLHMVQKRRTDSIGLTFCFRSSNCLFWGGGLVFGFGFLLSIQTSAATVTNSSDLTRTCCSIQYKSTMAGGPL